jgi:SOS response regulatory protein OraA/RecX
MMSQMGRLKVFDKQGKDITSAVLFELVRKPTDVDKQRLQNFLVQRCGYSPEKAAQVFNKPTSD